MRIDIPCRSTLRMDTPFLPSHIAKALKHTFTAALSLILFLLLVVAGIRACKQTQSNEDGAVQEAEVDAAKAGSPDVLAKGVVAVSNFTPRIP